MLAQLRGKKASRRIVGIVPLPENHPRFRTERGWVDQGKYLKYLRSIGFDSTGLPPTINLSPYDMALARFVNFRLAEAAFVRELHTLPDGLPINRQPWWKLAIWEAFWSGSARAKRRKGGG